MLIATVTGRLTKDAELRDTNAGPVLGFSVASNKKVKGEDTTIYVDASLFGKRGEALAQYLKKGTRVAVNGELSLREYQGRTYLKLRVSDVDLMGGKREAREPAEPPAEDEGGNADIPF